MNSRRDFLQKITGSLIAINLVQTGVAAVGQNISPQNDIGPFLKVAIMGLGSYGDRKSVV